MKKKGEEKEKEIKVRISNNTTCSNVFQESKPEKRLRKKKTFPDNFMNKTTVPKKEQQIRVYPDLMKSNDQMKGLLCIQEKGINPYENYPNHYKPKVRKSIH